MKGTAIAIASLRIKGIGSLPDAIVQVLAILDRFLCNLLNHSRQILFFPAARTGFRFMRLW